MTDLELFALYSWALEAMEKFQELCDDAQSAVGDPDGANQMTDVRELMANFEANFRRRANEHTQR